MAKGKKRKARKPPDNQFRGPRTEKAVQRRPETDADRDALAVQMERASGGSIPADVARRVSGEWPELAAAVAEELARRESRVREPADIHPALAGLSGDDEVPLIISRGDAPPPGAGPLLGTLDATATAEDGTSLSGAKIWLQTGAPPGPGEGFSTEITFSDLSPALRAARRRRALRAGRVRKSGEPAPVTLTNRIGDLLGDAVRRGDLAPGEIPAAFRRKAPLAGPVKAKLITGAEEGNALGIQPGDIIAEEQPIGYTEMDIDLSGDTSIPAGSKVYRVNPEPAAGPGGSAPFPATRTGWGRRDRSQPEPSAPRQPDVIVTDDLTSLPPGTDPGLVLDFGDDDGDGYPEPETDPVPEGMFLPPGFTPREPDPPRIMSLGPGAVLAVHDRLAAAMKNPLAPLLDMFDTFIGQELAKAKTESGGLPGLHSKWMGSFWPAKSASQWCGVLARQLGTARTYQVSAGMAGEVTDLYRAVQEHGKPPWIDQAEVPWPAGFAWLDVPLDFRDRWGRTAYNRALSWDVVYLPYGHATVPGVRIVAWSHPQDRDAYWTERGAEVMESYGGLSMASSFVIPFGQRMFTRRYAGYPVSDSVAVWVKALWHVMESEISVTSPARDPQRRPGWRPRSLTHGEVHVVMLRRRNVITPDAVPAAHGTRNWTCRWFVDPFWRHVRRDQQWEAANEERDDKGRLVRHHAIPDHTRTVCIRCGARVTHVATFDKGPAGLPFRQSRQLHKLTR